MPGTRNAQREPGVCQTDRAAGTAGAKSTGEPMKSIPGTEWPISGPLWLGHRCDKWDLGLKNLQSQAQECGGPIQGKNQGAWSDLGSESMFRCGEWVAGASSAGVSPISCPSLLLVAIERGSRRQ